MSNSECEGCGRMGIAYMPGYFCNRCYIINQKIKATGKEHCWICGKSVEDCDRIAIENGFDECEMLAK